MSEGGFDQLHQRASASLDLGCNLQTGNCRRTSKPNQFHFSCFDKEQYLQHHQALDWQLFQQDWYWRCEGICTIAYDHGKFGSKCRQSNCTHQRIFSTDKNGWFLLHVRIHCFYFFCLLWKLRLCDLTKTQFPWGKMTKTFWGNLPRLVLFFAGETFWKWIFFTQLWARKSLSTAQPLSQGVCWVRLEGFWGCCWEPQSSLCVKWWTISCWSVWQKSKGRKLREQEWIKFGSQADK